MKKLSLDFDKHFKKLNYLCTNLLINTEKYGEVGSTIAVTSTTFEKWGKESKEELESFARKS